MSGYSAGELSFPENAHQGTLGVHAGDYQVDTLEYRARVYFYEELD